tara:strand:+ start:138 stop:542 length:405 start_codon:yes stop_codon:yes gene_type:complete
MNINDAFPSKYLKADDFGDAEQAMTISNVVMEDIGSNEVKPILYFQGHDKGVVLNKTNSTNLARAFGDETNAWIGQSVILFIVWVDYQGKSVRGIRLRSQTPTTGAPVHAGPPPGNGEPEWVQQSPPQYPQYDV